MATLCAPMLEEESIVVESALLAATRVSTLLGDKQLTNATVFFFARDNKLFLIPNRHVVLDEANDHRPDRLEIEFHVDTENVTVTTQYGIPLYRGTEPVWRQRMDASRLLENSNGFHRESARAKSGDCGIVDWVIEKK